jgi:hypothetical protein
MFLMLRVADFLQHVQVVAIRCICSWLEGDLLHKVVVLAWTTTPRLSHRLDLLPSWFYKITWSQILRGGRISRPVCQGHLSPLCNLLPGISQAGVACQVGLWLCFWLEVLQVTSQEHLCWEHACVLVSCVTHGEESFHERDGVQLPVGLDCVPDHPMADPQISQPSGLHGRTPLRSACDGYRASSGTPVCCQQCTPAPHRMSMSREYRSCGSIAQGRR